jgi:RHS repeat-associated protein
MEVDGEDQPIRSYAWGLDLSGSQQGAGGVGGLCFETEHATNVTYHASFDYNGNLTSLRNPVGGTGARYEYGPFGESLTARDALAGTNPFRFSTKYTDAETGLLYYGYRYYNASLGRWLSRDPIEEEDGPSIYATMHNSPIGSTDYLGKKRIIVALDGAGASLGSPRIDVTWKMHVFNNLDGDNELHVFAHDGGPLVFDRLKSMIIDPIKTESGRCEYNSLVVVGFSWGAISAANYLSKNLDSNKVKVDLVFTVDPVRGTFSGQSAKKERNVSRLVNYFQRIHTSAISLPVGSISGERFRGMAVSGADKNREMTYSDFTMSQLVDPWLGFEYPITSGNLLVDASYSPQFQSNAHFYIFGHKSILHDMLREINQVPESRKSWKRE